MSLVAYSTFLLLLKFITCLELESTVCAGKNATSTRIREFCEEQGGSIIHRCCLGPDSATFIAVDLTEANLTAVPDFTTYENFNVSVIDIRLNPQLEPTPDNDFLGLTNLDELILPPQFDCPGHYHVWELIANTTDPVGINCTHQVDFCANSTDVCVGEASYCSTNGPNHFLCLCKEEYHGYKCLRKGTFPSGAFYGTTVAFTVVASIFLYWTQRRHVKS
ncbi:unnamed protein product [Adineta ricciae]|uniref:EGF-like domain-containing protein n=1 Tax=Adineta ricciae TaxID=249248 RepID=A0A815BRW8_ADIRI|nr:unnamed protein product [Adineta ricciae]